MQHLYDGPKTLTFQPNSITIRALVRFFALHRIKPRAPPLVRAPVNSFEFQPCDRTPQAVHLSHLLRQPLINEQPPSVQRLQHGLPGYLILFDTHAFVHQRQLQAREPPSRPVFLLISIDFTPTPGILLSPLALKKSSSKCNPMVRPLTFTSCLDSRLRTLYAQ